MPLFCSPEETNIDDPGYQGTKEDHSKRQACHGSWSLDMHLFWKKYGVEYSIGIE